MGSAWLRYSFTASAAVLELMVAKKSKSTCPYAASMSETLKYSVISIMIGALMGAKSVSEKSRLPRSLWNLTSSGHEICCMPLGGKVDNANDGYMGVKSLYITTLSSR